MKLPLEAAAVLLVAGLAIVIVQRSPELQHASRLDELRSPTPAPTTLAREAPAESTTALTGPAPTAPTPSSEGRFGVPLPDATSSTRSEFGSEPRQDTRDAEGLARVRERAPTPTERELTQNVPGTRAKKADAPPAEPRKEGSKVGGLAPTPAPPALTSTSAAPPATPSAPTASPPATAPSVSGATESMAKQVTPERRAAAQGLTQVAPGLQARLAVVDRAAAEVTVRDLVARATGLVLSQSAASQADAASTTYVLLVPADRWDELRRGLEGLGTLRVTGQKAEDAGQLLITLRLER